MQQVQQSRSNCNRFSSLRRDATGSAVKERLQLVLQLRRGCNKFSSREIATGSRETATGSAVKERL